jgi:uncharacterized protein (DUF305 family)
MTRTPVRRSLLLGVAATAAVALAACGGSGDSSSGPMSGMHSSASATASASASSTAAAFNDDDVMFAQMMIPHHQQAVEMAKLATTRASDAQVKALAQRIQAAQGPEITTMTGWLTAWGHPLSGDSMDMGHGSMPGMMSDSDMKQLKAATGAAFDKQFLTMMITHHQGAISMAKDEQAKGANTDAKKLAQNIITAQQTEIATMSGLLKQV